MQNPTRRYHDGGNYEVNMHRTRSCEWLSGRCLWFEVELCAHLSIPSQRSDPSSLATAASRSRAFSPSRSRPACGGSGLEPRRHRAGRSSRRERCCRSPSCGGRRSALRSRLRTTLFRPVLPSAAGVSWLVPPDAPPSRLPARAGDDARWRPESAAAAAGCDLWAACTARGSLSSPCDYYVWWPLSWQPVAERRADQRPDGGSPRSPQWFYPAKPPRPAPPAIALQLMICRQIP